MTSDESRALCREQIAGVPIVELAGRFGTPTYVYDEQLIRQRIADLRSFDVIRFAQKACSNLAILDVTGVPGVAIGDAATLLGTDGDSVIHANELAAWAETIPYEIICRVSPRVPRVYYRNGKVADVKNLLSNP